MTIKPRPNQRVNVCIIGAGPAGSSLAIRLAQLGHAVCIIERSVFPRPRLGECLNPGIWPQLELLGVARTIESAGFWPYRTWVIQWERDFPIRRDFGAKSGLLVDRGRFDTLLLEFARAHGVHVMQPAYVRTRRRDDQGWHLNVQFADGTCALDADFLADASGRSTLSRGHKQRGTHRMLALYGYWCGVSLPHEPQIEAGSNGWYWGVPLPNGTYNAIVFVDAADFCAERGPSLRASYKALIDRSTLMAGCRDGCLIGPVRAIDATPYLDGESIDPYSIKIGDSALALDPLSSSGVQKAINTALIGAVVVNTVLRRPERADAAGQFYTDNITEASDRHRRWAAEHYAVAVATRSGPFWQLRAADTPEPNRLTLLIDFEPALSHDLAVQLSTEAKLQPKPCIVGDLVAVKPVLHHPSLARPVAFLAGLEVAALLRSVHRGVEIGTLMNSWNIPDELKPSVANWLLRNRVLIPSSEAERRGGTRNDHR